MQAGDFNSNKTGPPAPAGPYPATHPSSKLKTVKLYHLTYQILGRVTRITNMCRMLRSHKHRRRYVANNINPNVQYSIRSHQPPPPPQQLYGRTSAITQSHNHCFAAPPPRPVTDRCKLLYSWHGPVAYACGISDPTLNRHIRLSTNNNQEQHVNGLKGTMYYCSWNYLLMKLSMSVSCYSCWCLFSLSLDFVVVHEWQINQQAVSIVHSIFQITLCDRQPTRQFHDLTKITLCIYCM